MSLFYKGVKISSLHFLRLVKEVPSPYLTRILVLYFVEEGLRIKQTWMKIHFFEYKSTTRTHYVVRIHKTHIRNWTVFVHFAVVNKPAVEVILIVSWSFDSVALASSAPWQQEQAQNTSRITCSYSFIDAEIRLSSFGII